MAGKFFFPTHFSEDAPIAFGSTDGDHTTHGFSPAFIARMEDRDRYLEDAINAGGLGGFTFEFVGPLIVSITNALPAPVDVSIAGFDFTFNVQSTAPVTIQYDLDGHSVGTTVIPASVSFYNAPFASPITMVAHVDVLQVRIVDPGTAGAGLVAVPYSS